MANEGSPVDTDNLFDPVFMHFENLDEELFLNGLSKDESKFYFY
jgi:hypothetical protein